MQKYHKIETLYKRDMEGSKKLIEGEFRNPVVEYLKDNVWIFTEKVDGTNIRVGWDGHSVRFKGRTDNASIPGFLLDRLNELFLDTKSEEIFEQNFQDSETILFGEGFGPKIQKGGGSYSSSVDFILFDVMVGETYLKREDVALIANSFGIKVVPIVPVYNIQQAVDYIKNKPSSVIAEIERPMEGVVGTPLVRLYDAIGRRVVVKIKVEDFE